MSTNIEQLNDNNNILSQRYPKRTISTKVVFTKKSNSKGKKKKSNNKMKLEKKGESKIPLHTLNENDKNQYNILKKKFYNKEDSISKDSKSKNLNSNSFSI